MPDEGGGAPPQAPPGPQPGAVQSGGAAGDGGGDSGAMLPPTSQAGAIDGGIPAQGLKALGMEIMRKAMGAIHLGRSLLDPYSEEGKAADTMFRHGAKHFKPDHDAAKAMQAPQMASPQGAQQPGGPPQMAGGGAGAMPQPPPGPIPRLNAATQ